MIVNPPQSVVTYGATANQVINGGFETGVLFPWSPSSGNTITSTNPRSGTYCLDEQAGGYAAQQSFVPPIPTSVITSLKAYYRQTGNAGNPCTFWALYSDGFTFTTRTGIDGSGTWQINDLTGFLDAGKLVSGIQIQSNLVSDTFWDDVELDAPATKVKPTLLLTYQPQN